MVYKRVEPGVGRKARVGGARGAQLAAAAATQFHRLGYHQVSLADVAAALGMTGPSVYRYFRNKQALLAGAILHALDRVDESLDVAEDGPIDALFDSLARAALERPELWVLLQRDARFLHGELRLEVNRRFRTVVERVTAALVRENPGRGASSFQLPVAAALAVLSIPSTHRITLPVAEQRRQLSRLARVAALTQATPTPAVEPAPTPPREARSRAEELLDTAIELFHERGYDGVSLDEIGAEVGIAGPSIYHHFATKSELLVAAFGRATERLAFRGTATPREVGTSAIPLAVLVRHHTEVGLADRSLFGLYVSEAINLPPEAGRRVAASLRAEAEVWTRALVQQRPALDGGIALLRVRAARGILNDLVRLGQPHARPQLSAEIAQLQLAVLLHD